MKLALFRNLHTRPEGHRGIYRDAYRISPGWFTIELGPWTLEVETSDRTDRLLVKLWSLRGTLYWLPIAPVVLAAFVLVY